MKPPCPSIVWPQSLTPRSLDGRHDQPAAKPHDRDGEGHQPGLQRRERRDPIEHQADRRRRQDAAEKALDCLAG